MPNQHFFWAIPALQIFFFFTLQIVLHPASASSDHLPPPLMLANIYEPSIELDAYWVSEKYDGVRAYWNGKQLISRQGNIYHAPAWFTKDFPDTPLDGELWMGRNTFDQLSGTVRKKTPDTSQWQKVRYMVFDLPASGEVFDARLQQLHKLFTHNNSPYLHLVEQLKIHDHQALNKRLKTLVAAGAEGLMLHRASSHYLAKRNDDLLKLKTFQDAEARVLAHLPGKGKFKGLMGSILLENEQGIRFKVGSGFNLQERRNPPAIGTTITYKYYGKTQNGLPRFASFMRIRKN
ncbi:MAG: DNA ligase [Alteromonadaceae bacterium]|nr:MAG: DNA ligase [Alteromonadaceae bacterium]